MIRAGLVRTLIVRAIFASAALTGALALAGCDTDGVYQLPTRAMKELSPQMLALLEQKGMPKDSPILVRLFKEESELEVWKQDTTGRFQLLKVYPICRWSGDLGPKVNEGDRQAPEGFYTITPNLMNPNSNYYLAINTGFPNTYDKANGRHGAFLMIHGDCSSRGCYAMTDEQIGEIYSLAREALLGGQQSFQIQAYPFHMTPANLAHHRTNPAMSFWRMIKEGNDHFEVTRLEPKVEVCDRHYVFDPQPPVNSTKPLVFNPTGRCPAYTVAPEIAGPTAEKERNDDAQFTQLVKNNLPLAPIRTGIDGGMNRVFLAQVGQLPPARVAPPDPTGGVVADLPPQPQPATGSWLGGLFGSKQAAGTQVAATDSASQERGGGGGFFSNLFSSNKGAQPTTTASTPEATASQKSQAAHSQVATAAHPKPKAVEPEKPGSRKSEPQETNTAAAKPPQSQQDANAAAQPAANPGVLSGAQPVVPAGNFDSRWAAVR